MKANKIYIVLVLAVVLLVDFGCKSTKEASKSKTALNTIVENTNKAKLDIELKTNNKQSVDSSKLVVDKGTVNETTVEETTTTKFSKPDSTGKQFKESETKTKKSTTRGESKNLKVNQETKSKSDDETELRDQSKISNKSTEKDKSKSNEAQTTETETPTWIFASVFLLIAGILSMIFFVVKRLKAVK